MGAHTEEAQPGEDLHPGKASHSLWHGQNVVEDLGCGSADGGLLGLPLLEGRPVRRRGLLGREDRPEHGDEEGKRAYVEGERHRKGDGLASRTTATAAGKHAGT